MSKTTEKKPWDGFTAQTGATNEKKSPLDGLTPEQQRIAIAHARSVLRKSSEYVIDGFEETQEQLLTLAASLLNELTPPDPKNPPDDWPRTAWRLAQILEDYLGSTLDLTIARQCLLGEK